METNDKLIELVELLESARRMPLSSSVLVNKQDLLERLDQIRQGLPSNLAAADEIIAKRESILAEARSKAELLIDEARGEQARLVAEHTVLAVARAEAERTRNAALEAANAAKRDVNDHLDAKLAHLEMIAERMLETARKGRERVQGTTSYDQLAPADDEESAPLPAAASS